MIDRTSAGVNPRGICPPWRLACLVVVMLLVAVSAIACSPGADEVEGSTPDPTRPPIQETVEILLSRTPVLETVTPTEPQIELALTAQDITITPLPVRAGYPFTITAQIHNRSTLPAVDVPVLVFVSADLEELGYTPFAKTLTRTVPASDTLTVNVPVDWNFAGGDHQVWIQVNRQPEAWATQTPVQPEAATSDNLALVPFTIEPFDAYVSDLCPGRVDVEITPEQILPDPEQQRILVRVRNVGNQAVYNLPVLVTGQGLTGIAYTPVIEPCGGTADVYVRLDDPIAQGQSLTVQVSPQEWAGGLEEDDFDNNEVTVSAGLAPGLDLPQGTGRGDYDFVIGDGDIEIPEPYIVVVTVRNLGTRDAAMVPIRLENEAGQQIIDAIPLVQGEGLGIAAIRADFLWVPGETLTLSVNPEGAEGTFPESNRQNNVTSFTLP